jgi:hypothetical protein
LKRPSHLLTFAPKKLSVHHNPPWKCQTPYDKFGIILQIGWVWCQCSSRTTSVYFFHKCKGCSVHDVDKHCSSVAWPSFCWIFPFKTSIYIESYEEQAKATWGWTKDSRKLSSLAAVLGHLEEMQRTRRQQQRVLQPEAQELVNECVLQDTLSKVFLSFSRVLSLCVYVETPS